MRHEQYQAEGKEHMGIVLSTEETISVLRRRLLRLLKTLTADDLRNQMRWLNEFKSFRVCWDGALIALTGVVL